VTFLQENLGLIAVLLPASSRHLRTLPPVARGLLHHQHNPHGVTALHRRSAWPREHRHPPGCPCHLQGQEKCCNSPEHPTLLRHHPPDPRQIRLHRSPPLEKKASTLLPSLLVPGWPSRRLTLWATTSRRWGMRTRRLRPFSRRGVAVKVQGRRLHPRLKTSSATSALLFAVLVPFCCGDN